MINKLTNILIELYSNSNFALFRRFIRKMISVLMNYLKDGVVQSIYGYKINYKKTGNNPTALRKSVILGSYELGTTEIMKALIREGDYVIDIGAHEGYMSLVMSSIVGDDGKVFSFEPNHENLEYFKRNVKIKNIKNIQISEKAIGKESRKMPFYYQNDRGAWGSLMRFSDSGEDLKENIIQVDTLDNLFKINKHEISFIKVDTEGNEFDVFMGGGQIIRRDKPHICFEVNLTHWSHLDLSIDELFSFFLNNGYELFVEKDNKLFKYTWLDTRVFNMFAIHQSRVPYLLV